MVDGLNGKKPFSKIFLSQELHELLNQFPQNCIIMNSLLYLLDHGLYVCGYVIL